MFKIDSNHGKFGGVNVNASEIKSKRVLVDSEGKKDT